MNETLHNGNFRKINFDDTYDDLLTWIFEDGGPQAVDN